MSPELAALTEQVNQMQPVLEEVRKDVKALLLVNAESRGARRALFLAAGTLGTLGGLLVQLAALVFRHK